VATREPNLRSLTYRLPNSYDDGEEEAILQLFADLVASGDIDHLPGRYAAIAQDLIADGWISEDGEVLVYFVD
jgi:hypothetical protein